MKNVLCIRADNMGDVIMSSPALRALKETFSCSITLLTSAMGAVISPYIPFVEETMICQLPWSKNDGCLLPQDYMSLVNAIRERAFDAAVIFTVYSQNPLPAALLAWHCGIPVRLAYCRENPYGLLTHWAPEKEPYSLIKHQVQRDLDLVALLGARASDDRLVVDEPSTASDAVFRKLRERGVDPHQPYVLFHAPVSEAKRTYPVASWIGAGKEFLGRFGCPLLLTGTATESTLTAVIAKGIGQGAYSMAGEFEIGELIALTRHASLLVSVNTGNVHIAAATQTPVVVLYALTNPQHTPWKVASRVLYYSIREGQQSKNEVIRYVHKLHFKNHLPLVTPEQIVDAAMQLLKSRCIQI